MAGIAVALVALTLVLAHGTGHTACMVSRVATCQHVPAPARPVANQPSGS